MWRITAVALAFLLPIQTLRAEGGTCPPGYYPVNSPGVMGCAPMPTNGGSIPDTGPLWATTWGAIAVDGPAQVVGTSHTQKSKRKAHSVALSNCRAKGGAKKNCSVLISFYNQCAAIAGGDSEATTHSAPTPEQAGSLALNSCSLATSNCKVLNVTCTFPVRVN
ncbi:MAG: DUF4189 domain-containing protein [Lysobacter sp.]|nr:DUF4189 domain-containing protein [Lysobacter sp.]